MTVLVDSWAWIEYFKGSELGKRAKDIIESYEQLLIATINLSEIYRFLLDNKPHDADKFIKFVIGSSFVIPLEVSTALKAAKIKKELKIGLADAIVIATAEENKGTIITGDPDFENMKNVIYIGR